MNGNNNKWKAISLFAGAGGCEEGGRYAIGEDAWNMLTDRAGEEMGFQHPRET